jgi:3-oxoacyl-[acyl-carrier-protein] synthase III
MYIVGVGAAYPSQEISDSVLGALPGSLASQEKEALQRYGITSRRTSLPVEFIQTSGAGDVLRSRTVATDTPTTLGAQAVRDALTKAQISIEQVGLIIADSATPYQTCPSEAQRIGGEFGIKIPAYDVVAGVSAIPFFLNLVGSWKETRLPEYVVCVSTNTPTQQISYASQSLATYTFGDAASAVILSRKTLGKLRVISAKSTRSGSASLATVIERSLAFTPTNVPSPTEIVQQVRAALTQSPAGRGTHYLIGPQLCGAELSALSEEVDVSPFTVISGVQHIGYALGSSTGVALNSLWEKLLPGDKITLVEGGDGVWSTSTIDVSA